MFKLQGIINIFSGAQIFRMLVTNTDKSLEERIQLLENKFASVEKKHFSKYHLVNDIQFVIQYFSFHKESKTLEDTNPQCIFFSYNGGDLQQEETEGMYLSLGYPV